MVEARGVEPVDKNSYLVTVMDNNTIQFDNLDPATGKTTADSYPFLFVREEEESAYI